MSTDRCRDEQTVTCPCGGILLRIRRNEVVRNATMWLDLKIIKCKKPGRKYIVHDPIT